MTTLATQLGLTVLRSFTPRDLRRQTDPVPGRYAESASMILSGEDEPLTGLYEAADGVWIAEGLTVGVVFEDGEAVTHAIEGDGDSLSALGEARILPPNKELAFGFWGTMRSATSSEAEADRAWNAVSKALASEFQLTPEQVRDVLHEKLGRHLADEVYGMGLTATQAVKKSWVKGTVRSTLQKLKGSSVGESQLDEGDLEDLSIDFGTVFSQAGVKPKGMVAADRWANAVDYIMWTLKGGPKASAAATKVLTDLVRKNSSKVAALLAGTNESLDTLDNDMAHNFTPDDEDPFVSDYIIEFDEDLDDEELAEAIADATADTLADIEAELLEHASALTPEGLEDVRMFDRAMEDGNFTMALERAEIVAAGIGTDVLEAVKRMSRSAIRARMKNSRLQTPEERMRNKMAARKRKTGGFKAKAKAYSRRYRKRSDTRESIEESYAVRWQEVGKGDKVVSKEKDFSSEKARAKFIDKLEDKDNFVKILAMSDPQDESADTTYSTSMSGKASVDDTLKQAVMSHFKAVGIGQAATFGSLKMTTDQGYVGVKGATDAMLMKTLSRLVSEGLLTYTVGEGYAATERLGKL